MEHFFMRQDYYTLIFDNQKQMNLMKDTTIDHVVVEKVFYSRQDSSAVPLQPHQWSVDDD